MTHDAVADRSYDRVMWRFSRTALLLVAVSACALDQGGGAAPDGGPTGDASMPAADASASLDASPEDSTSSDAPIVASDAAIDADPDAGILATCLGIFGSQASPPNGSYKVDPLGTGAFPVLCDMANGGWTLVGRELVGEAGQFRFLDVDSNNAPALAAGTASGLIGKRFIGKYTSVRIEWGASALQFTKAPAFDLFANTVDLAVPLTAFSTTDAQLGGWVTGASGAVLCVASHDSDQRPGDTSWAVTGKDDKNRSCGCDSGGWAGRGAYYGGTINGQQTACDGYGGGWAGVKDNNVAKGGIVPSYETRLWIK